MIHVLSILVLSRWLNFAFAVPPQNHSAPLDIHPAINDSVSAFGVRQILECDSRYGVNLDILDCRNAIQQLKTGPKRVIVADREDIFPGDDATIPLPYRLMGSKSASTR